MYWTDDYPVMLVKENEYAIMEVELYEGRIVIQPIYTANLHRFLCWRGGIDHEGD